MNFVFSNAPHRIAGMTREMAWAAIRLGHHVFEENTDFEEGKIISKVMFDETVEDPFVYGHVGLTLSVHQGNCPSGWRVSYDPLSFDAQNWKHKYGKHMWNDVTITTLGEAFKNWNDSGYHMRPSGEDSGPKAFKGFFATKENLANAWSVAARGYDKNMDMLVALSDGKLPYQEYRLAYMNDRYIDGSLYLENGKLKLSDKVPQKIIGYADEVAKLGLPSRHCAVDIALSESGELGVIEFNSLHSSGLYAMDRTKIINGISESWK